MSFFDAAYAAVLGIEAGFTKDPRDPGNWTGGSVGLGELKGTKGGISAAAYPHLDIENLQPADIKELYRRDYWVRSGCDAMSWERAICAFDCAVNQGVGAEQLLNAHAADATELMTQRALRYAHTKNFELDGHSWMHRLFTIFKAAQRTPT